jgi:hypothetical protein
MAWRANQLGRRQQVEAQQAEVAPGGQQRLVAAEQARDLVGKADGQAWSRR